MKIKKILVPYYLSSSLLTAPAFAIEKDSILGLDYADPDYGVFLQYHMQKVPEKLHISAAKEKQDEFDSFKAKAIKRLLPTSELEKGHSLLQAAVNAWEEAAKAETAPYAKGFMLAQAHRSINSTLSEKIFECALKGSFEYALKGSSEYALKGKLRRVVCKRMI